MRATLPWSVVEREEKARWPLVVNAPDEAGEGQTMTVFRAMAIWIGLELGVIAAVVSVV